MDAEQLKKRTEELKIYHERLVAEAGGAMRQRPRLLRSRSPFQVQGIATTNRNNPHEVRCVLSHRRRKHCFSYSTEDLVQLLIDLLKGVNQRHALVMVTLILVAIPIVFLNEL